jgi:hypothetical protein
MRPFEDLAFGVPRYFGPAATTPSAVGARSHNTFADRFSRFRFRVFLVFERDFAGLAVRTSSTASEPFSRGSVTERVFRIERGFDYYLSVLEGNLKVGKLTTARQRRARHLPRSKESHGPFLRRPLLAGASPDHVCTTRPFKISLCRVILEAGSLFPLPSLLSVFVPFF